MSGSWGQFERKGVISSMDTAKAMEHIKNHISYPATAGDLKAACNNMSEFSDEDKKWVADKLPEGTYNSAEEVIKALGW